MLSYTTHGQMIATCLLEGMHIAQTLSQRSPGQHAVRLPEMTNPSACSQIPRNAYDVTYAGGA